MSDEELAIIAAEACGDRAQRMFPQPEMVPNLVATSLDGDVSRMLLEDAERDLRIAAEFSSAFADGLE